MSRHRLKAILLRHKTQLFFLFITWGLFFSYVFLHTISLRKDGLYFGHPNAWSDWSLHVAIANIFAYKDPSVWFSYHPLFADGKFTYPFLMDFISGIFMRLGFSLTFSFIFPSIIFSLLMIISLYFLFYLISNSKNQSLLAINIFLLSSGMGFLNFISDFLKRPKLDILIHPVKEYSKFLNYEWYTGSVIVGFLIPQRAFLMGFTFGFLSLIFLLYPLLRKVDDKQRKIFFAVSGVFAGILPVAHPHSFIVLIIIEGLIVLANIRKIPKILIFVVVAGLLSSVLYFIFIRGGVEIASFFTFLPGWTSKGFFDFIYMWAILWGPVIPASILGFILILKKNSLTLKMMFLGFFMIFIFSNILLFQPLRWDNTKLFWWVYVGLSILTAIFIARLYRLNLGAKIAALMLVISVTFTGILEVIKVSDFQKNTYLLTPREDIDLGFKIRREVLPLDIFATATTHNNLVMVWGLRPILLGYTAWALNYGFDYREAELDLYKIYRGDEETRNLLEKHNIRYVFIGPAERSQFEVNEEFFRSNFPLAFSNSVNKIYYVGLREDQ